MIKKKGSINFLVVLAVIAIIILIIFMSTRNKTTPEETKTTSLEAQCKEICKENEDCYNECLNPAVVDETDLVDSNKFIDALNNNDVSKCSEIIDEDTKNLCIDSIQLNKAISENDETLCNNIKDENLKNRCKNIF